MGWGLCECVCDCISKSCQAGRKLKDEESTYVKSIVFFKRHVHSLVVWGRLCDGGGHSIRRWPLWPIRREITKCPMTVIDSSASQDQRQGRLQLCKEAGGAINPYRKPALWECISVKERLYTPNRCEFIKDSPGVGISHLWRQTSLLPYYFRETFLRAQ